MSFESTSPSGDAFETVHSPGNETPNSSLASIPLAPDASIPDKPQLVEASRSGNPPETVTHHFYSIAKERKLDLLVHAIKTENLAGVLVFSHTKHGADMIARRLVQRGIAAVAVHSDRSRGQRERALESFKRGSIRALVATDIAIRGIDIIGISHIVNFEVPASADDYMLRIRGTGWTSPSRSALTFVSHDEEGWLRKIQKLSGQHHPARTYPGLPAAKGIDAISNERPKTPGHAFSVGKPRSSSHAPSNERPNASGHAFSVGKPRSSSHAPSNDRSKSTAHTFPKPKARPFGNQPRPSRKKKAPIMTARKKKPVRKLESFSSFMGDPRYS
jgi:superfamily II DNA/RNA helicase